MGLTALVFCAALFPRVFSLGRALTTDEAYHWQDRSARFLAAISDGRFADTMLTGHPGVTTMWLGSLGLLLERALLTLGLLPIAEYQWTVTTHTAGLLREVGIYPLPIYELHLTLIRLPLALTTALLILCCYLLLRRVLGGTIALAAALLWASDPFLVAHSRVLHLDALVTMFSLTAVLALLAACFRINEPVTGVRSQESGVRSQESQFQRLANPRIRINGTVRTAWSLLALAGIATGLAQLTKAPAVLLLPIGGLVLFVWFVVTTGVGVSGRAGDKGIERQGAEKARAKGIIFNLQSLISSLAIWLGTATLTAFAFWPAMWVAPLQAIQSVVAEVVENGGVPHNWGNFLLGQAANDPGPLFYPITLLARIPPWTTLGLLACVGAGVWTWTQHKKHHQAGHNAIVFTLIAVAGLVFLVAMTLAAKKADRYILPAFPFLHILAAAGLVTLINIVASALCRPSSVVRPSSGHGGTALQPFAAHRPSSIVRRLCSLFPLPSSLFHLSSFAIVGVIAAGILVWYHPYYLAYYSPLIGGSANAINVVPVGWGEGIDLVADWLNEQPDLDAGVVATWSPPTLQGYLRGSTELQTRNRETHRYFVVYALQTQTGKERRYFNRFYPHCQPQHIVRLHDIDYARIYRVPQATQQTLDARFGDALLLRDATVAPTSDCACAPQTLALTLAPPADLPPQTYAFIHIIGPDGRRVKQIDMPLEQLLPSPAQQSDHQFTMPLPTDIPAGSYDLFFGLYQLDTGARLSLASAAPLDGRAGPDALHIGRFDAMGASDGCA
jgi:hypothetical protein